MILERLKLSNSNSLQKVVKLSEGKTNLIETDDAKDSVNKIFSEFLKLSKNEKHSRYTSKGAVYAKRFNKTITCFFLSKERNLNK